METLILSAQNNQFSRLGSILRLLEETTSLGVVTEFLKAKKLTHSASSWDDMKNKRLLPAIASHLVSEQELIELLRSAEECGRQHVFLFHCSKDTAATLMERSRVTNALTRQNLQDLLTQARVLDQPSEPTIADVRWVVAGIDTELIVKIIETRVSQRFVGETRLGNQISRNYEEILERSVNVVRLHRNGLLEIRLGSHSNSTRYASDLMLMWRRIDFLLSESDFTPISLLRAKNKLWTDRATLSRIIRFSDHTLVNDNGNTIRAATGTDNCDLLSDDGVVESLEVFLDHDAYCDSSNIWFKTALPGPSKEIHVLLSGELNEFAVPAHCSPTDYQYVLDQLRLLNA